MTTGLKERLQEDLKNAIRAGDGRRKLTLRLVLDAVHKAEIPTREDFAKGQAEEKTLDDGGILKIIGNEAKKRREAIAEFEKGGRTDLVAQEKEELAILQEYLPQQLSEEEIEKMAKEIIARQGAKGVGQMGQVMKEIMPQVQGKAEGSTVSGVVRRLLESSG
ncbi:MAG: GatB/YqeY domain-containing protein [Chloroflexi bacterium]|nr:GatB/YqeY domain-containing protein [Chloroflexota bacterium]